MKTIFIYFLLFFKFMHIKNRPETVGRRPNDHGKTDAGKCLQNLLSCNILNYWDKSARTLFCRAKSRRLGPDNIALFAACATGYQKLGAFLFCGTRYGTLPKNLERDGHGVFMGPDERVETLHGWTAATVAALADPARARCAGRKRQESRKRRNAWVSKKKPHRMEDPESLGPIALVLDPTSV